MGKSRARKAAKTESVFSIARGAAAARARGKGRARRVTSALKKINTANADKISKINKAFAEIQKEVQQLSEGPAAEPQKNEQHKVSAAYLSGIMTPVIPQTTELYVKRAYIKYVEDKFMI